MLIFQKCIYKNKHDMDMYCIKKLKKYLNQKCALRIRIWKNPNFDKTLFKKDLQNEEEGFYKIYIKEVFGNFL
jgi:hypothetical protein